MIKRCACGLVCAWSSTASKFGGWSVRRLELMLLGVECGARSKLHWESSSVIVLLLHFHYHWGAAASIAATMCTAPQLRAAVLAVSAEDSVFSRPPRSQLVPLHCTQQLDSCWSNPLDTSKYKIKISSKMEFILVFLWYLTIIHNM